jgi:hypothetical protein
LRTNHSEDINLERQIEPYIDEGELEENIKLLTSNETVLIEEAAEMIKPNFTEIPIKENSSTEEPQSKYEDEFKSENTKQCGTLDFTGDGFEGPVTIPVKKIGHAGTKEPQSKYEDEFKSENTKQCETLDFTGIGFEEGPVTIFVKKISYSTLVKADTNDTIEDRKVKMRITFCVAFVSVVVCVSLVSCIVRRKQFGEMLERYSSSNKVRRVPKKEQGKIVVHFLKVLMGVL